MKNITKVTFLTALSLSALIAFAQDGGGRRPGGGPGGQRPPPPIVTALDTNKDGKLDAAEIAAASATLKTLDKNGDGEISAEEMFGPRPQGRGGPGGPGQFGPPPNQ